MSVLGDLVKMYEIWDSWKDQQLTEPEKELLALAEENGGEICIISTDQIGEFVVIGKRNFIESSDPAVRVRALEALEKLYRRGLVRHEGGIMLTLTGSGFDKARELKKQ